MLQSTFGQISPQLIAAINSLYVYACTGQGKAAMRENAAARTCIRLAVRDRDFLFTEQERSKLDNMIEMSEVGHFLRPHAHMCYRLSAAWSGMQACRCPARVAMIIGLCHTSELMACKPFSRAVLHMMHARCC
jgi:hypothetical protein